MINVIVSPLSLCVSPLWNYFWPNHASFIFLDNVVRLFSPFSLSCHRAYLKRKLKLNLLSWLGLDLLGEKNEPACIKCKKKKKKRKKEGEAEHLGKPFFFFLECWRVRLLRLRAAPTAPWTRPQTPFHLLHHVAPLSAFRGPFPLSSRVLLFGGEVPGGVENAASDGGYRHHSQEHRSLPALLPRRSGETRLPQRSHHCVVGLACMGHCVDCMHCRARAFLSLSLFIRL